MQVEIYRTDTSENGSPFSMETFEAVMSSTLSLRDLTLQAASANIKDAQKRQKKGLRPPSYTPCNNSS